MGSDCYLADVISSAHLRVLGVRGKRHQLWQQNSYLRWVTNDHEASLKLRCERVFKPQVSSLHCYDAAFGRPLPTAVPSLPIGLRSVEHVFVPILEISALARVLNFVEQELVSGDAKVFPVSVARRDPPIIGRSRRRANHRRSRIARSPLPEDATRQKRS
jgi:hypothetical protein